MAKRRKERPGVILYFDTRHCIQRLDLEEKGRLLDAILNYGESGRDPEFSEEEDIALCVAWDVLRPRIDLDARKYSEQCTSNAYASYVRDCKAKNTTPIEREQWEASYDTR